MAWESLEPTFHCSNSSQLFFHTWHQFFYVWSYYRISENKCVVYHFFHFVILFCKLLKVRWINMDHGRIKFYWFLLLNLFNLLIWNSWTNKRIEEYCGLLLKIFLYFQWRGVWLRTLLRTSDILSSKLVWFSYKSL